MKKFFEPYRMSIDLVSLFPVLPYQSFIRNLIDFLFKHRLNLYLDTAVELEPELIADVVAYPSI